MSIIISIITVVHDTDISIVEKVGCNLKNPLHLACIKL